MASMKRFKTRYPGVVYVEGLSTSGSPEKIFYIRYRKGGRQIEEKAGRQHQEGMTAARASHLRAERIQGKQLSNQERREEAKCKDDRWTISRLWAEYCETHAGNKILRAESLKFDKYLRAPFGEKEPGELVALDVDRLRVRLQKQGKLTSAARVIEILRRTINFGVKRGIVPPLRFKIEVPKLNNETTEDLSQDQIQALMAVLDADPDRKAANIMRLALLSGMRRSEILKLKWEHLDFGRGFIRIVDPKSGRDEVVPMSDSVRAVLNGIERQGGNPYVFPGKFPGSHLTECRNSIERIRKAAGLPEGFRPLHGLRHVFASTLASSGEVDLYTLQKLLTHKSPIMTQRYAHLRDEALRKASNLAGDIIDRAATATQEAGSGSTR